MDSHASVLNRISTIDMNARRFGLQWPSPPEGAYGASIAAATGEGGGAFDTTPVTAIGGQRHGPGLARRSEDRRCRRRPRIRRRHGPGHRSGDLRLGLVRVRQGEDQPAQMIAAYDSAAAKRTGYGITEAEPAEVGLARASY